MTPLLTYVSIGNATASVSSGVDRLKPVPEGMCHGYRTDANNESKISVFLPLLLDLLPFLQARGRHLDCAVMVSSSILIGMGCSIVSTILTNVSSNLGVNIMLSPAPGNYC